MNDKLDQGNRTFIGSVCFVDIVGYSKKSVSEQIMMKDRFTMLLSEALKDVAIDQRIILDTGDGAAISFLGDPEDALFVTMHMRDFLQRALIDADEVTIASELGLRIGINLGPVKLIRDINGQPNIVGDGINVAQRIMSFAQPTQIVVSRSYYDVVSVISEEYAKLFHYEGSRTDKHVREHEIYIVGESAAAFNQAKAGMVDRAATTNTNTKLKAAQVSLSAGVRGSDASDHGSQWDESGGSGGLVTFLQDRKKRMTVGGILTAVVLALVVALVMKKPNPASSPPMSEAGKSLDKPAGSPTLQTNAANTKNDLGKTDVAPGTLAAVTDPSKPADGSAISTTQTGRDPTANATMAQSAPPASAPTTVSVLPTVGALDSAAPAVAGKPADSAKTGKADPGKIEALKPASGTVLFNIQPWGEILVNGKSVGVSPPLKHIKLQPGKYKIEVKNSTFTPLTTSIEVKSKEQTPIKHRFQ